MTEKEAASMLSNMRLAAPEMDSTLVELLSRWALRGRHGSPEPKVVRCPVPFMPKPILVHQTLHAHEHMEHRSSMPACVQVQVHVYNVLRLMKWGIAVAGRCRRGQRTLPTKPAAVLAW